MEKTEENHENQTFLKTWSQGWYLNQEPSEYGTQPAANEDVIHWRWLSQRYMVGFDSLNTGNIQPTEDGFRFWYVNIYWKN
jgi:hypothetical protein